jgi:hypothetical protein
MRHVHGGLARNALGRVVHSAPRFLPRLPFQEIVSAAERSMNRCEIFG